MGRVKIKRKSTLIDMTAMSDVTVLLLTFFMLTSTFLQKEPVVVKTPSSISEQAVPANNLVTVLVDQKENVFISITGSKSMSSDTVRMKVLNRAVSKYNKLHPNEPINLTSEQVASFGKLNMFVCPFKKLPQLLSMPSADQDLAMNPDKPEFIGSIQIDGRRTFENNPNEFQIWMLAYRDVAAELPAEVEKTDGTVDKEGTVYDLVKQGKVISVKADEATPFSVVRVVMDNLQTLSMNKFSLMTSLKQKEN